MDSKKQAGQKGGTGHPPKQQQQRPGTEQVRSGANIQQGEHEKLQVPKSDQQVKQKNEQGKH